MTQHAEQTVIAKHMKIYQQRKREFISFHQYRTYLNAIWKSQGMVVLLLLSNKSIGIRVAVFRIC